MRVNCIECFSAVSLSFQKCVSVGYLRKLFFTSSSLATSVLIVATNLQIFEKIYSIFPKLEKTILLQNCCYFSRRITRKLLTLTELICTFVCASSDIVILNDFNVLKNWSEYEHACTLESRKIDQYTNKTVVLITENPKKKLFTLLHQPIFRIEFCIQIH